MSSLPPFFNAQFFAVGGAPAAGFKLHTYDTGTSTPKVSYTDQAGAIANANPIILDAEGRCDLWLDTGEYAFELRTPANALVERWDDIGGIPAPDATPYLPLAGGESMTGTFELAGPATSALEPVTLDQMQDEVAAAQATLTTTLALPIGAMLMWAQGSIPTGFLALEGGTASRTTYAALFALWGVTYGTGDGSLTFGLPDTRAYGMRGWDNGRGVDSGRALGTFQEDAIQNITGNLGLITGGPVTATGPFLADGAAINHVNSGVTGTDAGITFDASRNVRTASETRTKNFSVRFIVKALA